MARVPYFSAIASLVYDMICIKTDICYIVGFVNRYQSKLRKTLKCFQKNSGIIKENYRLLLVLSRRGLAFEQLPGC